MNEKRNWTKERRDYVVREIDWGFMVILVSMMPLAFVSMRFSLPPYNSFTFHLSSFDCVWLMKQSLPVQLALSTQNRQPFLLCEQPILPAHRLFLTYQTAIHHVKISSLQGCEQTEVPVYDVTPTNSRSSPKPISIELVMPSSHLTLCRPLLLLP